jgi:hypothetical protein
LKDVETIGVQLEFNTAEVTGVTNGEINAVVDTPSASEAPATDAPVNEQAVSTEEPAVEPDTAQAS